MDGIGERVEERVEERDAEGVEDTYVGKVRAEGGMQGEWGKSGFDKCKARASTTTSSTSSRASTSSSSTRGKSELAMSGVLTPDIARAKLPWQNYQGKIEW